jgi:cytochrome c
MTRHTKYQSRFAAAVLAASAFFPATVRAADCDLAAGAKLFQDQQCAGCHTFVPDDFDKSGPNLHGVVGRKAGTANFGGYSDALKKTGITWDSAALDRWITNPAAVAPGTAMPFAGLPDAQARATLVCYLTEKSR